MKVVVPAIAHWVEVAESAVRSNSVGKERIRRDTAAVSKRRTPPSCQVATHDASPASDRTAAENVKQVEVAIKTCLAGSIDNHPQTCVEGDQIVSQDDVLRNVADGHAVALWLIESIVLDTSSIPIGDNHPDFAVVIQDVIQKHRAGDVISIGTNPEAVAVDRVCANRCVAN